MSERSVSDGENYTKSRRHKRFWRRSVTAMAAVVVFCTIYALILPAITLEKKNDIEYITEETAGESENLPDGGGIFG